MIRIIGLLFAVLITACAVTEQDPATFTNPVLAGFYPDPSICRVGEEYYLVNSSFSYFPGIPLFHSRDLVNWKQLGSVMERPEQMDLSGLGVSRGIFAPAISYHQGTFYVVCTLVDAGGNFVVTAEDPAGDWSNPVWLPDINGIDPSLFFDDDGKAYIIYNSVAPDDQPLYSGHRTLRMREFDPESLKTVGPETILVNGGVDISEEPVWIEAPHLYKINGAYYLMAAEGGTAEDHSEVIFRSQTVQGPYEPYDHNPILTQRHLDPSRDYPVTCTGHADMVQTPAGDWWAVFLGCRPYPPFEKGYYNTGRETFMAPVQWIDGWPVINPDYEKVQYSYPRPDLPEWNADARPYSGNFMFRDEFTDSLLHPSYLFLRTPHQTWHSLNRHPGQLAMDLRPETCSGTANPSLIAHRQQHMDCNASVSLNFTPQASNEKAGLIIFQNETHFYYLCQSIKDSDMVVQLFQSDPESSSGMKLLQSAALPEDVQRQNLLLRIGTHENSYSFSWAADADKPDWTLLKDRVDASFLSTQVAGGFVGAVFGMYTTSLGETVQNEAIYDWFEYSGNDPVFH
ncbi:MAG: glycoside hydrolase family 43 protein [candidate division KSB1 bacterium]|nr:glycoside hydrolase family 43 protein [candidate division KSB1 bacterium]